MMKVEETPIFYKGQNDMCCLLYSILYGGNCNRRRNCGCREAREQSACGCSRERESYSQDWCGQYANNSNCGCSGTQNTYAFGNCCGAQNAQNTQYRNTGCGCCASRCCSGYGRHGGECVCGDWCYYCRQYALCCGENKCGN